MKRVIPLLFVFGFAFITIGIISAQPPPPPCEPNCEDDEHRAGRGGQAQQPGQRPRQGQQPPPAELVHYGGGDHTVNDASSEAFTNPLANLTDEQMHSFDEGDELFEKVFVAAVEGAESPDDGLGPLFNATSCEGCHVSDGRGLPEAQGDGLLIRLATTDRDSTGGTVGDTGYGGQFQDMSIDGMASEGAIVIEYTEIAGAFEDGTPYTLRRPSYRMEDLAYGEFAAGVSYSPRVGNHIIGLGLLEAISEETILSYADPTDDNGDGITGRPNYVWDFQAGALALGRFGWKANQPNLTQQAAGAFNGDMGLTTHVFPNEPCTAVQADCLSAISGGSPEISDEDLEHVSFYVRALSIPAQRDADDPQVRHGGALFVQAQCSACHLPQVTTGEHPTIPQLSHQTISPFTDLLLHDMGEDLADNQDDFLATGSEWRTAPLWGIGLFETVNGHTYYLHDGRARSLTEAILWHGGEAESSRTAFLRMTAEEREALLAYLRSI